MRQVKGPHGAIGHRVASRALDRRSTKLFCEFSYIWIFLRSRIQHHGINPEVLQTSFDIRERLLDKLDRGCGLLHDLKSCRNVAGDGKAERIFSSGKLEDIRELWPPIRRPTSLTMFAASARDDSQRIAGSLGAVDSPLFTSCQLI